MSSYLNHFYYQILGPDSETKWVFLHGLMGAGQNWRSVVKDLAISDQILLFDQRGHGRSFHPEAGYAPLDYAEDLKKILEELGWKRIQLVGHSMGGRNALAFASHFPEFVDRLMIVDIGPEANFERADFYRKLLETVPTPFVDRNAAKQFFQDDFENLTRSWSLSPFIRAFLYSNLIETTDGRCDWRFSKEGILQSLTLGRSREQWDDLRKLPMKTLIIRGENSIDLPKEVFSRMKLSNPLVSGVEIPNAGHWVHADQPAAFMKAIREFVLDPS